MKKLAKPKAVDKRPAHLGAAGGKLWADATRLYPLNDVAKALLLQAAESLDRVRAAQLEITRDGATIENRFGQKQQHPALKTELDSRTSLLRCLRLLNFDLNFDGNETQNES